jgi:hypothetical protein
MPVRCFVQHFAVMSLPALLLAFPAEAQKNPAPATQGAGVASQQPQAPVGHRQPTAADVAGARPKAERDPAQERRDRALNSKLQICRGC